MIFLLQFDRSAHRLVRFERFDDSQRDDASRQRLALEIGASKDALDHEIVLLEAQGEPEIRQTHRRYFENVEELVTRFETGER